MKKRKKLYRVAYGKPKLAEGFLTVRAVSKKAAEQQVRRKTGKRVLY